MPETTKQPTTLAPYTPPTPSEVLAFYRLGDWERARKVATVRAALEDGTYETPDKLDIAVERMLPDVLGDKGDFAQSITEGMRDNDVADAMLPNLALPAAGVGTEDVEARGGCDGGRPIRRTELNTNHERNGQ